jgi:hypothetical protein
MKSSTKTKQITEIIFDKEVNPFVSKKISENALGTCSYFENLNKNNIKDLSFKIETEYEDNPKSPDETKITDWLEKLKQQEVNQDEWKQTGEMILKQIVSVYPDYKPRSSAKVVKLNKADLLAEAKARFAK